MNSQLNCNHGGVKELEDQCKAESDIIGCHWPGSTHGIKTTSSNVIVTSPTNMSKELNTWMKEMNWIPCECFSSVSTSPSMIVDILYKDWSKSNTCSLITTDLIVEAHKALPRWTHDLEF